MLAGLSPADALFAATGAPAEYYGLTDRYGSIASGKMADLLLLDANPLDDVANTERLAGVMVRGRWLPAAELRRMREEATAPRRLRRLR